MNSEIAFYLPGLTNKDMGATEVQIAELENSIDFLLPPDYVEVMKSFNGWEGEVGDSSWLQLFPIEELLEVNKDYSYLMSEIPNYFLIGKDAADTGFAFHKYDHTFHAFGLMSDFERDHIDLYGSSFLEFVRYLYLYKFNA